MRIVGGIHGGRRLHPPVNLPIRPTTDRAREGIFNMLAHRFDFEDLRVLDLFAGSGAMALEFGSRGCPAIVAVDQHPGCIAFIRKTAGELGLPIRAIRSEVTAFARKWKEPTGYDLIFADPPYAYTSGQLTDLVESIWSTGLIKEDGLAILEHAVQYELTGVNHFQMARDYGSSRFSFFGVLDRE